MCAATHKDTHAMRRQTERRYEDQRERERAGRTSKHCRKACWETHKEGRGGEADRVSPLTVWHSWMWDGNPRQTDSWGQTAALSLWPQQPNELKTRCCSSTNVHQRPPKRVSVKKSNFTVEISMSLYQKNSSTHITAFKCLTWSILNQNLSFSRCRKRQRSQRKTKPRMEFHKALLLSLYLLFRLYHLVCLLLQM